MKSELDGLRSEAARLQTAYTSSIESEQRERAAAETLRKQLNDVAISRQAEIEILEQASRQQAQVSLATRYVRLDDGAQPLLLLCRICPRCVLRSPIWKRKSIN